MIRVESYTFFGAAGAHSTQAGIKKFSCEIESRKLSSGGGLPKFSTRSTAQPGGLAPLLALAYMFAIVVRPAAVRESPNRQLILQIITFLVCHPKET